MPSTIAPHRAPPFEVPASERVVHGYYVAVGTYGPDGYEILAERQTGGPTWQLWKRRPCTLEEAREKLRSLTSAEIAKKIAKVRLADQKGATR